MTTTTSTPTRMMPAPAPPPGDAGRSWACLSPPPGNGVGSASALAVSVKGPWPRKVLSLADENAVIVLHAHSRQLEVYDDTHDDTDALSSSPRPLKCLPPAEGGVVDFCRFLRHPAWLLVVTAAGRAWQLDWRQDTLVGPVHRLRGQQSSWSPTSLSGTASSASSSSSSSPPRLLTAFRHCLSGEHHILLVDRHGQAWSWGRSPQAGQVGHAETAVNTTATSNDAPRDFTLTRIDFFQGYKILSSSCGRDFNVALVDHRPPALSPIHEDVPDDLLSGGAAFQRLSCPLGLPLQADDNDDGNEEVQLRKKDKSKHRQVVIGQAPEASTNDEKPAEEKTPAVERLTHSGIYINPSDAIKYLSDQLSWVGLTTETKEPTSPTPASENKQPGPPTSESNSGEPVLARASSVVSGGVRLVSQTMSRLSSSLGSGTLERVTLSENVPNPPADPTCGIPLSPVVPVASTSSQSHHKVERSKSIRSRDSPPSSSQTSPHSGAVLHRRSQSASMLDMLALQPISGVGANGQAKLSRSAFSAVNKHDVLFWGRGHRGQSGQGDKLDRLQPISVPYLSDLWILKVVCGRGHIVALSLAGSVYGWGDNTSRQASPQCNLDVCVSPTQIYLPTGETAIDVAACDNRTVILSDCGSVYVLGFDREQRKSLTKLDVNKSDSSEWSIPRSLLSSGSHCFVLHGNYDLPLCNFKATEKLFLQKLHAIYFKVVEPLFGRCKDSAASSSSFRMDEKTDAQQQVLRSLAALLEVVSQSVKSSWDFAQLAECGQISYACDPTRLETAFTRYHLAVCNMLVLDDAHLLDSADFAQMSPVICEILRDNCHKRDGAELDGQDVLLHLLKSPLSQLSEYSRCFKAIVLAGRRQQKPDVLRICDQMEKCVLSLRNAQKRVDREQLVAEETKKFWNLTGAKFASLKTNERRVLLDSRVTPVSVANAGSFSKNWLILMNDTLVHAGFSSMATHALQTVWIENHQGLNEDKFEIVLVMPEETLTLVAASAEAKNEWFQALQKSILDTLDPSSSSARKPRHTAPITRKTRHIFTKIPELKGAEYVGNWLHGRMHGQGCLTYPDGTVYTGQWRQNQKHGCGVLKVKGSSSPQGITVYDGQWRMDKFEGYGRVMYGNGDHYEGMLKEGKPHGQGTFKQGKFMDSGASVYIGEWVGGQRQGYGVSDDIILGEKYMGLWHNNMKDGPGCVVTLDGVYYEGTFRHNKMTGMGLMLFEDETSYEGSFADAGVFSGQGVYTHSNGDRLDGSFFGNYADGMKFNGTFFKKPEPAKSGQGCHLASQDTPLNREKIGKFSVSAERKWTCIFSSYYENLCLPDPNFSSSSQKPVNASVIWEQLAIQLNQAKNNAGAGGSSSSGGNGNMNPNSSATAAGLDALDGLERIPDYYSDKLTQPYLVEVNTYLCKAFSSPLHPLRNLLHSLTDCFSSTYGGVRVHPRLLKHAVEELESVVNRLFYIVRALFPALPPAGSSQWVATSSYDEDAATSGAADEGVVVTASSVIYPHILPPIHLSIFMLYTLYYKKDDDDYWSRILKWNKHPDLALLSFLGVDQKFWHLETGASSAATTTQAEQRQSISRIRDAHFVQAIETLQHIKTKFTPYEKLTVILQTFREVNRAGQEVCGKDHFWSMDDLFPVFQYIVVRARILQLGAEIHLIEDLMEQHLATGEYGIMFTTLQASYYQILKESLAI